MKFKYRFKGKVNNQFVLRGMLFVVGAKIDFCVSEKELDFVKQNCSIIDIIDLEEKTIIETPKPVLEENKETENKPKGVKVNGNKQVGNSNQRKNNRNI